MPNLSWWLPGGVKHRQEQVGDPLLAVEVPVHAGEIIAAIAVRSDLKQLGALRLGVRKASRIGEPDVEQRTARKVGLLADGAHVQRLAVVDGGLDRVEKAESVAVRVVQVVQEAAREDVAGREIDLEAREVAAGDRSRAVLAVGQAGHDIVTVEGVEAVMEPGAALIDGAGEFEARCPLVDVPPALGGDSGNEIGAGETPAVIAHLGLQVEDAGRAAAVLGGKPAGGHVHRLDGIDVDPRFEQAGHGVRKIEAVQRVVGLAGAASVEMGAARIVLHNTVHERQGVAVVLRSGVRNRLDFGIVELPALLRLLRIDGGRRGGYVDAVGEFLQMIQGDDEIALSRLEALGPSLVEVEAETLGANGVITGLRQRDLEVAGAIGRGYRGDPAARAQFDAGAGDSGAGFIDHAAGNRCLG